MRLHPKLSDLIACSDTEMFILKYKWKLKCLSVKPLYQTTQICEFYAFGTVSLEDGLTTFFCLMREKNEISEDKVAI